MNHSGSCVRAPRDYRAAEPRRGATLHTLGRGPLPPRACLDGARSGGLGAFPPGTGVVHSPLLPTLAAACAVGGVRPGTSARRVSARLVPPLRRPVRACVRCPQPAGTAEVRRDGIAEARNLLRGRLAYLCSPAP